MLSLCLIPELLNKAIIELTHEMALVKQYLFVPRNTIGAHQPKITNAMRGLTRRSKAIETIERTISICLLKLAETFIQHLTVRCI